LTSLSINDLRLADLVFTPKKANKAYMNQQEIISRINAFMVEDFEVDEQAITPEADLKATLDLDSLDYIDLVVAIEQNFGFKVKPEDFQTMVTIQDFYNYVSNRLETVNA
jgi:acyl carrier protein